VKPIDLTRKCRRCGVTKNKSAFGIMGKIAKKRTCKECLKKEVK
jgi:hypothetical protein